MSPSIPPRVTKLCRLIFQQTTSFTLFSISVHRREESALVPTRPQSRTVCPMQAAGALAYIDLTTAECVGTAVAAPLVAHVQPA